MSVVPRIREAPAHPASSCLLASLSRGPPTVPQRQLDSRSVFSRQFRTHARLERTYQEATAKYAQLISTLSTVPFLALTVPQGRYDEIHRFNYTSILTPPLSSSQTTVPIITTTTPSTTVHTPHPLRPTTGRSLLSPY